MKQVIKTWMFATILLATSSISFAQDNSMHGEHQRGNRQPHEEMMEHRADNIAKQLGLDAKTSKKFLSVYKKEQSEMMEMMHPHKGGDKFQRGERPQGNPPTRKGKPSAGRPQMSENDRKKMDSIKQKYNKKYAKFLSQEQISKMYQLQEQERQKGRPNGRHQ